MAPQGQLVGTIVVSVYGSLTGLDPIDDECVTGSADAPVTLGIRERVPVLKEYAYDSTCSVMVGVVFMICGLPCMVLLVAQRRWSTSWHYAYIYRTATGLS